jgi:hypothetical protein
LETAVTTGTSKVFVDNALFVEATCEFLVAQNCSPEKTLAAVTGNGSVVSSCGLISAHSAWLSKRINKVHSGV